MRSVLRQKILRPRDVFIYAGGVNEVVSDLIKRIRTLRSREDDGETVTNVNDLYFKYSMEGLWMGGIYLGFAVNHVFLIMCSIHYNLSF